MDLCWLQTKETVLYQTVSYHNNCNEVRETTLYQTVSYHNQRNSLSCTHGQARISTYAICYIRQCEDAGDNSTFHPCSATDKELSLIIGSSCGSIPTNCVSCYPPLQMYKHLCMQDIYTQVHISALSSTDPSTSLEKIEI